MPNLIARETHTLAIRAQLFTHTQLHCSLDSQSSPLGNAFVVLCLGSRYTITRRFTLIHVVQSSHCNSHGGIQNNDLKTALEIRVQHRDGFPVHPGLGRVVQTLSPVLTYQWGDQGVQDRNIRPKLAAPATVHTKALLSTMIKCIDSHEQRRA
jgi:hypothetical protein